MKKKMNKGICLLLAATMLTVGATGCGFGGSDMEEDKNLVSEDTDVAENARNSLESELIRYKEVFGEEFGLKELLALQDLKVKALIAEAINNVPEFLLDQIGKARNSYEFPSLVKELGRIADVMEEVVEGEGE